MALVNVFSLLWALVGQTILNIDSSGNLATSAMIIDI